MPKKNEERRFIPIDGNFRATQGEDGKRYLEGYAAVFDKPADIGWYREYVRKSAFTKTLKDGADVRALFNHNPDLILGRTTAKTVELKTDDTGLFFRVELPDTSYAKDLLVSVERKDVTQNSFGFRVMKDNWFTETVKDAEGNDLSVAVRELLEVQLFDVSPVTYPAYPQTSLDARSADVEIDYDRIGRTALMLEKGLPVAEEERKFYNETIERMSKLGVLEPGDHSRSAEEPDAEATLLHYQLQLDARMMD